ncbi:hypothetical protein LP7551_00242 [Roseibium album]|nr:hypothetical protein LP7551_00242 [Roseibium album]
MVLKVMTFDVSAQTEGWEAELMQIIAQSFDGNHQAGQSCRYI